MLSLGIDESYTRVGIAITDDYKRVLAVNSYGYKGCKCKTEKRRFMKRLVKHALSKYKPDVVMIERIRTFSQGFISTAYIQATGALIATIVDAAYPQPVYSCDTRSWKSQVIGPQKRHAGKIVSVDFIRKRYGFDLDDDAADAICISLYSWCDGKKVKVEK